MNIIRKGSNVLIGQNRIFNKKKQNYLKSSNRPEILHSTKFSHYLYEFERVSSNFDKKSK
jgi:hypothetical protein